MILTKLAIENFGSFKERTVFNLAPTPSRPIILFGGLNGAGKTTIFDSVRICLYGKNFSRTLFSEAAYSDYIRSRIHRSRNSDGQAREATIKLEFEQKTLRAKDTYEITRHWKVERDESVSEQLIVVYNGQTIRDVDSEWWQNYLNDIIPKGIADLFFFDGEKIQNLADDSTMSAEFADSIKMLLGLDLVERLRADLSFIKSKRLSATARTDLNKQLSTLKLSEHKLRQHLEDLGQDRAQQETKLVQLTREIEKQEQRLAHESGGFAGRRQELKDKIAAITSEITIRETELRERTADTLPFVLAPGLCLKLKTRIVAEQSAREEQFLRERLQKIINRLDSEPVKKILLSAGVSTEELPKLRRNIADTIYPKSPLNESIPSSLSSSFSDNDRQKILALIDRLDTVEREYLLDSTRRIEKLYAERAFNETMLNKIPEDIVLTPILSRISELNQELGSATQKVKQIDERLAQARFSLVNAERATRKIQEEIEGTQNNSQVMQRINAAQKALTLYSHELTRKKLARLEEHLLTCFNCLHRKRNFVSKISVDLDDFSVALFTPNGSKISNERLAAGEKQILAVSILWALTKVSNRKLPFIIDTPLARLDGEHRSNLVGKFFPNAGDQVIILSTDTEIVQYHLDLIRSRIARAYHLVFHVDTGVSEAIAGYFWELNAIHATK